MFCYLRLPVESASGEPVVAEGVASKKKEAIVACALEACRILDSYGVLRTATHGEYKAFLNHHLTNLTEKNTEYIY